MTSVQQDADVVVRIEPWSGTGYAKVRVTPGYRKELQALLTEADLENSMAAEFSTGSDVMELISVAVGTPEFWEAMGVVVAAFIGRHAGKRVRVEISPDRTSVEQRGYSRSDAVRLIREAAKRYDRSEAEWQEMLRHHGGPTVTDPQRTAQVGGRYGSGMQVLLDEIARMPDSALRFARGVSEVRTPEHLVGVRQAFLAKHQGDLGVLFAALRDRFPEAGGTINCFYAAADAALMAHVDTTLTPHDRVLLRQLWEALLHAS